MFLGRIQHAILLAIYLIRNAAFSCKHAVSFTSFCFASIRLHAHVRSSWVYPTCILRSIRIKAPIPSMHVAHQGPNAILSIESPDSKAGEFVHLLYLLGSNNNCPAGFPPPKPSNSPSGPAFLSHTLRPLNHVSHTIPLIRRP